MSHKQRISMSLVTLPSSLSSPPSLPPPHLAASIPSQVELSLISTRSLLMLACSYSSMNRRAFAIEASLSKDSLGGGGRREGGEEGEGGESGGEGGREGRVEEGIKGV